MISKMNFYKIILFCFCFVCLHLIKADPYVGEEIYVGCYENFDSLYIRLESMKPKQCLITCAKFKYHFAATKQNKGNIECHCGRMLSLNKALRVSSDFCLRLCKEGYSCWNADYYAVYFGAPDYLGCYIDRKRPRDVDKVIEIQRPGTLTNRDCVSICEPTKSKYMGTQYSHECYCGHKYGTYGIAPESECHYKCAGDNSQTCGGDWRNSVYNIQDVPQLNISYSDIFHCIDGYELSKNKCKTTKCKQGWMGTKCNIRDCTFTNGNCGIHRCIKFGTVDHLSSECICRKGFGSLTIYNDCIEIS